MPRTDPFRDHTERYEEWFETFDEAYESEVAALESLRPDGTSSLEVGVGTCRFAVPLQIEYGLDPTPEMAARAQDSGITVVLGVAEELPYRSATFELVLFVTTICFVDDLTASLREAHRVLRPGGSILLGYIDKESRVGKHYQAVKDENPFYRDATFYSTETVLDVLETVGFSDIEVRQTIFQMPDEMDAVAPVKEGYGDGSFVALGAGKSLNPPRESAQ